MADFRTGDTVRVIDQSHTRHGQTGVVTVIKLSQSSLVTFGKRKQLINNEKLMKSVSQEQE